MATLHSHPNRSDGFSLIELLVAMAIGLLLLAGLSLIFVNSSQANRELQNTAQQIENGRYASDVLTKDLHHAGFYGRLYLLPVPTTFYDPCEIADLTVLTAALSLPVQGYRAADLASRADVSASTCDDKGLLTNANLQPGSDVLVIRRAHTLELNPPAVAATASVTNDIYIQTTGVAKLVRLGTGAVFNPAGVLNKDGSQAPIRKYIVHVYFVAPCSVALATSGVCAPGTAGEDTIPTLKRLELVSQGGVTKMIIVPLVEGIEYLKIEYGVDNLPTAKSTVTYLQGDAAVDTYATTPATLADWPLVVTAKIYLLARNTASTMGHVDNKSYILGTTPVDSVTRVIPADYAGKENFRRHSYTAIARLLNVAGRKEIP